MALVSCGLAPGADSALGAGVAPDPLASDAGTYDVVVSHACTSVYSEGVELGVNHCVADFNSDAVINSQDFFDFLSAYFAGLPAADVDGSGTVDSQDVFAYLEAFFGECV